MDRAQGVSGFGAVHFGGPDLPPRALRDLLQREVDAASSGSTIDWCTYYFRDEALARALIAASDRGVDVRLIIEAWPRCRRANRQVIALLANHGLRGGFRLHAEQGGLHSHLHTKIYAFGGARPKAFIGSFNPSGNDPEDPEIIAEIGDQDRGHNLLVEIADPALVGALSAHARDMTANGNLFASRFTPRYNRSVESAGSELYFFPRLRTAIVEPEIAALGKDAHIRAAISHLKDGSFVHALIRAAAQGCAIDLIVHDTERRVPSAVVDKLRSACIKVHRYRHPEGLPMHCKFLLIQNNGDRAAWTGSANFNQRSRYLNEEILIRITDGGVFESLAARFAAIAQEPCLSD